LLNLRAISGSFTNAAVSGNTISKDSRYQDESFYQFSKGNPIQVTPFSGISTSYVWDYVNTQPIAKATNAAADQIAYTSFEADGTGNWTIGSSSRDTTAAITGKKMLSPEQRYLQIRPEWFHYLYPFILDSE